MRLFLFAAGVWFASQPGGRGDDKPGDVKALQGEWEVTEHRPQGEPKVEYVRVVFKDNKLTLHAKLGDQKSESECEFTLDAAAKSIDFTPTKDGKNGLAFQGLYEIKADQLRICYRGPRASRPKSFDDKIDGTSPTTFLVLKRKRGA